MNLIFIPFHDWRKSEREGFRTRDVHMINEFSVLAEIDKVLIINRPTTPLERLVKNNFSKIKGELIRQDKGFCLYRVSSKTYVTTYSSLDIAGQIQKKQLWFIEKYAEQEYLEFIKDSLSILEMETYNLIVQNVFAYKAITQLNAKTNLFDAWDNFLRFPAYKKFIKQLEAGYKELANSSDIWISNSQENVELFKNRYNPYKIHLVRNGVNLKFKKKTATIPKELKSLKRPIIGFGGKISYLLDVELINYLTEHNQESSFVFVGQILNKSIYNQIVKRSNVYFLGDKHYDIYPNYVQNFDICIIPYRVGDNAHGGDSIKAYEFLICGKKVVGTCGNGLLALKDYIYLATTPKEFLDKLMDVSNDKELINPEAHSWKSRIDQVLKLIN